MSIVQGVAQGLLQGLAQGLNPSTGVSVPSDGGRFFPVTEEHFAARSIATPSYGYRCDEASGGLAAMIGSATLAANNAVTYEQAMASFDRVGVGCAAGSGQRFEGAAAIGAASFAVLAVCDISNAGGAGRHYFSTGGSNHGLRSQGANGVMRLRLNGANSDGSVSHSDGASHPLIVSRNTTDSLWSFFSDIETFTGTYNSADVGGTLTIGGTGGATPGTFDCCYFLVWLGAAAETIGRSTLVSLGYPVSYS